MSQAIGSSEQDSANESSSVQWQAYRVSAKTLLLVALYTAAVFLPTIGSGRVLTYHEVLAAEPAREMLNGKAVDWIIPKFASVPRMVKPPTTGWIIAGSMALFHSENEWVVRLPTALSAMALTLIMTAFCARWLGSRAALAAGLLQPSFGYVLIQGRLAEADMPMCAAIALAMWAFAAGNIPSPAGISRSRRWPVLFYLGTALSFLIKGVGPIFILAGCAAYIAIQSYFQRNDADPSDPAARQAVRFFWNPVGLALFVILAMSWPLAAFLADPHILKVWRQETVGRASGEFGASQPWYFFFLAVPILLVPWIVFAIGGLIETIRRKSLRQPISIYCACWFAAGLIILSCSAFKHDHYAIPMLPPVTLAAAAGVMLWTRDIAARSRRHPQWLIIAIFVAVSVAVIVFGAGLARVGRVEIRLTIGIIAVGGAAVIALSGLGRAKAAMAALFVTTLLAADIASLIIIPRYDDYRATADFARRANSLVPTQQTIHLLELKENQTAFYLRLPIQRIDRSDAVVEWLATNTQTSRYAICSPVVEKELSIATAVTRLDYVSRRQAGAKPPEELVLIRIDPIGRKH